MKKPIIYVSILVFCLLLSRFIDFSIYSVLAKEENRNHQSRIDAHFEYIGFSSLENAKSVLSERKMDIKNKFIVLSFYDIVHPLRLLVFNKGEKDWILLFPQFNVDFETGLTELSYCKFNRVKIKNDENIFWQYSTVMCSLYHYIFKKTEINSDSPFSLFEHNRFEIYSLANESWLKKIYIVYFYIPFILILVFYRKYNIKFAFLYFLIMPIFFFPKHFVFDSIFNNFFDDRYSPVFGSNPFIIKFICFGIFLAFWYLIFKNIVLGIIDIIKKRNKTDLKEKLIILYFILLPIVLRF